MTHDVVIEQVEIDEFGSRNVINSFPEKGFIQYDRHRIVNDQAEEITADAIAFLKADSSFDPQWDRWNIRDVKNDRTMQMKGFQVIDDPRTGDTHHYEVSIL